MTPDSPQPTVPAPAPKNDVLEGKFFAAISYISFFCIVTLVLKRENKFALYHAKHGLVLFLCEVILYILSAMVFLKVLLQLLGVVLSIVCIWGIVQSLMGTYSRIPVLTDIAEKITL